MKAVVRHKGQVTIPKALRERLGIACGTVLDFGEENGRLVARKATEMDAVAQVVGCLSLERPTDVILAELRGRA